MGKYCRRSDLLARVHQATRQMQEEAMNPPKRRLRAAAADSQQPVRDGNVDLITIMLEALEKEHEFLCAHPLNVHCCAVPRATLMPLHSDGDSSLTRVDVAARAFVECEDRYSNTPGGTRSPVCSGVL